MKRKQTTEDRKRHEVLSRMLLDRQAEIKNKLRSLREALPTQADGGKDAEELSMEDFVRDMDVALMEMESETLRRIDEALLRLDEGTYGFCAQGGEKIAEARLRALPFATLCRDCQEDQEEAQPARIASRRSAFQEEPPPKEGRGAAGRPSPKAWSDSALTQPLKLARLRI